mgnify:FL=1
MNIKKKRIAWIAFFAIVIIALAVVVITDRLGNRADVKLTAEEAQALVDKTFTSLPKSVAKTAKAVFDKSSVTVNDVSYGDEKDIILDCTYKTVDILGITENNLDELFGTAYGIYKENSDNGKKTNATSLMLSISKIFDEKLADAKTLEGSVKIYIYELHDGTLDVYLSDDTVNTCFGGIAEAISLVKSVKEVEYNGETVNIENMNTIRSGISDCIALSNYSSSKPDTSTKLIRGWNGFKNSFYRNFIQNGQWHYLTRGLLTTLEITALAVMIGIVIGFLVAIVRVTNLKTGKLPILSKICSIYLSVIRGTPVMIQLLIIYFVILLPIGIEKFPAAVLCFGFNSGAYVSEIVRGGIMSVDAGQTEAGRSLGFNYSQTMLYIVIPQAFKAVLPALANEFITLLKESSVAFYIGVADLTQGGLKIRSITYSNFMPLIAVAIIYLVVVLGLSKLVGLLEKRLQKGDR